jgi:hypothetical protein
MVDGGYREIVCITDALVKASRWAKVDGGGLI